MKHLIILLTIVLFSIKSFGQHKTYAKIIGHADFLPPNDTIKLTLYKYGFINGEPIFQSNLIAKAQRHAFSFILPDFRNNEYVSIQFKEHSNDLYNYFVLPGEQLKLTWRDGHLTIAGVKSNTYKYQYELRKIEQQYNEMHRNAELNPKTLDKKFRSYDIIFDKQLAFLERNKNEIGIPALKMLKSEIYGATNYKKYGDLLYYLNPDDRLASDSLMQSFTDYLKRSPTALLKPELTNWYSYAYVTSVLKKIRIDYYRANRKEASTKDCLTFIINNYISTAREQLAVGLLTYSHEFPSDLRPSIKALLPYVTNQAYRKYLENLLDTRVDGAIAYDFTLIDTNSKIVHLSDFKGKLVVLDFWFTGCLACKELAPHMKIIENKFDVAKVAFISICGDRKKDQWLKSIKAGSYASPDIINLFSGGTNTEIPVVNHYKINAYPTLLVITQTGKVVNVMTDPRYDNGDDLMKILNDNLK